MHMAWYISHGMLFMVHDMVCGTWWVVHGALSMEHWARYMRHGVWWIEDGISIMVD